jgi:hypothetical protein
MGPAPTRKDQRISAVIPVRLTSINEEGEPVSCLAHTLNVSRRGARLAGVGVNFRLGTVVKVHRGRAMANFRVIWVGSKDPKSVHQVGIECLEVVSNFWGLEQLHPVDQFDEREHSTRRARAEKPPK